MKRFKDILVVYGDAVGDNDAQTQAIGWLRRKLCSLDGGTWV